MQLPTPNWSSATATVFAFLTCQSVFFHVYCSLLIDLVLVTTENLTDELNLLNEGLNEIKAQLGNDTDLAGDYFQYFDSMNVRCSSPSSDLLSGPWLG